MAWSDAARRAAAIVRQLHKKARADFPPADYRAQRGWDIAGIYTRGARSTMAADLRATRAMIKAGKLRQPTYVEGNIRSVAKGAAVSTATRNFFRRQHGVGHFGYADRIGGGPKVLVFKKGAK